MSEHLLDILVWEVRGMDREKKGRVPGYPDGADALINKYGTYEVQDTVDTDNVFPTIGYEGSEQAYLDGADKVAKEKPEQ